MGRPPTPVGTYGGIGFTRLASGSVRVRALYRDFDGITQPVPLVRQLQGCR